jgi:hypothetical protein
MKTAREPSFFIPGMKRHQYEGAYESMKAVVKYQMGWTVKDRRIESLTYSSGKKTITAKVGEFGAIEHRHEVAAIMEASLYLIMTKTPAGEPGPTILVDPKEVLEVHDFKQKVEKPKAVLQPVV